jgi:anti-anti-sigma regulatory factor
VTTKPHFIELYTDSLTELRAQFSAAVDETRRRQSLLLEVGLDSLPNLDDSVIAAAITALRRLREFGGTLRLITKKPSHRRTLSATGLDHVFELAPAPLKSGDEVYDALD